MKLIDENKDILFCKRAFSEVVEGAVSKVFLGEIILPHNLHPLAKICDMKEFLTLNLIPT